MYQLTQTLRVLWELQGPTRISQMNLASQPSFQKQHAKNQLIKCRYYVQIENLLKCQTLRPGKNDHRSCESI